MALLHIQCIVAILDVPMYTIKHDTHMPVAITDYIHVHHAILTQCSCGACAYFLCSTKKRNL